MESAKEYGFESDYDEYQDFDQETASSGGGQPKSVPGTAKEVKKKLEAYPG